MPLPYRRSLAALSAELSPCGGSGAAAAAAAVAAAAAAAAEAAASSSSGSSGGGGGGGGQWIVPLKQKRLIRCKDETVAANGMAC
jgi:hypothetical protein